MIGTASTTDMNIHEIITCPLYVSKRMSRMNNNKTGSNQKRLGFFFLGLCIWAYSGKHFGERNH